MQLLDQVYVDRPFVAPHAQMARTWATVATKLRVAQMNDSVHRRMVLATFKQDEQLSSPQPMRNSTSMSYSCSRVRFLSSCLHLFDVRIRDLDLLTLARYASIQK